MIVIRISHAFRRSTIAAAVLAGFSASALAHHGFGLFQMNQEGTWSGTLTKMNLVNPHSYMEFDSVGEDGEIVHMRCEMRAASLLRRAGWDTSMFTPGAHVEIYGRPHRDDPTACYIETFTLDDSVVVNRNDLFAADGPVDFSNRPYRLADGQVNLSGDWAVEQLVLTIGPEGGNGSMVPRSLIEEFASGELTIEEIQAMQPPRPRAVYTEEGQAAAQAFNFLSPEDNPWFACKPTSIIRDWTADWPINRFVQRVTPEGEQVIDITYGLYNFERRIHVGMEEHPADLEPSYAGHSIGRWDGDTLVVETVGLAAGVLSPPTRNSEQLRIVERFTLDPETMALKREYSATDPVYLAEPYESYDVMHLSDVPFAPAECVDMTPEFQAN
jgi:hypothetical protein